VKFGLGYSISAIAGKSYNSGYVVAFDTRSDVSFLERFSFGTFEDKAVGIETNVSAQTGGSASIVFGADRARDIGGKSVEGGVSIDTPVWASPVASGPSVSASVGASADGKTVEFGIGGSYGTSALPADANVKQVETGVKEFTPQLLQDLKEYFNRSTTVHSESNNNATIHAGNTQSQENK
jgi:hypothetical protein